MHCKIEANAVIKNKKKGKISMNVNFDLKMFIITIIYNFIINTKSKKIMYQNF